MLQMVDILKKTFFFLLNPSCICHFLLPRPTVARNRWRRQQWSRELCFEARTSQRPPRWQRQLRKTVPDDVLLSVRLKPHVMQLALDLSSNYQNFNTWQTMCRPCPPLPRGLTHQSVTPGSLCFDWERDRHIDPATLLQFCPNSQTVLVTSWLKLCPRSKLGHDVTS